MKKKYVSLALGAASILSACLVVAPSRAEDNATAAKAFRKISVAEYRDKMKAGWIGQIAGVSWGAPTEFRWTDKMIPEGDMPTWRPEMINDAFGQDDLYVEMTFLKTLEDYGLDVSIRQAGLDFANSEYMLWHANNEGRTNLRMGIAPPNSSHPAFNKCADDIDYQIEADFSGLVSPGLPNNAVRMGETFGRLMNYGDGLYAGQFVGAMYSEAFFETDVEKIIRKALEAIPAESQYAEMVRDVLQWKREFPNDWEACWNKINEKYQHNPEYRKWSCSGKDAAFNIDAKINGAYILVGLLYGEGDLDKTIIIATRCGQDSDCNPSNAAGILFTTLGFKALPPRFSEKLDESGVFSHTAYNFPALIDACEKIAVQALLRDGGSIVEENGEKFFYIPVIPVVPSKTTSCANPVDAPETGDAALFNEEELAQIKFRMYSNEEILDRYFSGFSVAHMGPDMNPGYRESYRGRENVFMTHPESREVGAVLSKTVTPEKGDTLVVVASHHANGNQIGDYVLKVKGNGRELLNATIGSTTVDASGWARFEIPLDEFAGQETTLEIVNEPDGWGFEAAYFAQIAIVKK